MRTILVGKLPYKPYVKPQEKAELDILLTENPIRWVERNFDLELLPQQHAFVLAAWRNEKIAGAGCHSSLKTHGVACAICWFMARWWDARLVVTGPSEDQLKSVMAAQLRSLMMQSKTQFPKIGAHTWPFEDAREAFFKSPGDLENIQGQHSNNMMLVVDEGSKIQDEKNEAAMTSTMSSGDTSLLLIGNPIRGKGMFFDAFHTASAGYDTLKTISAFETPNFRDETHPDYDPQRFDGPFITLDDLESWRREDPRLKWYSHGFSTRRIYVWEMLKKRGRGDQDFRSRCLAEFPTETESQLLSHALLADSMAVEQLTNETKLASLDVGGQGRTLSVGHLRDGDRMIDEQEWGLDVKGYALVGAVIAWLAPHRQGLFALRVDANGAGGVIADLLEDEGFPVERVMWQLPPTAKYYYTEFANQRAQDAYRLLLMAQSKRFGGKLSQDTIRQLTQITYKLNNKGVILLNPKKQGERWDHADSAMMCYRPIGPSNAQDRSPVTQHAVPKVVEDHRRARYPAAS